MRQLTNAIMRLAVLTASVALASCGGGGGSSSSAPPPPPPPPPPPDLGTAEGLWNGTTGSGRSFSGLVPDDGTYWFLYSAVGNDAVLGGVVEGDGTSSSGKFTSSNGMDFNLEGLGINVFTLAGTYTVKSQLGGTLTYTGGTTNTFTSTYDPDYDLTPSLATIVGTYSGEAATVDSGPEATIGYNRRRRSHYRRQCQRDVISRARYRPMRKEMFKDVSVTFNGGVCTNGTSTVTGLRISSLRRRNWSAPR